MRLSLQLVSFLAALGSAAAQVTPAATALQPGAFLLPIHTHQGGDDPTYGVWASAPTYKVSFHDGFTFYPLLGDGYPANLPLRWRETSMLAGGQQVAAPMVAVARQSAWRYEYDHGPVREVYDVRAGGVEQSFVVPQRPAQAGDLVISGRIDTRLVCAPVAAAHQALEFRDDRGNPIVRYGAAFAIDAAGARVPVQTAFDGARVALRVDGAWLAQARFPIIVDPLTSTVLVGTSTTSPVTTCDVGQEGVSTTRNVVVAVERAFSATDHDVTAYACDLDFGNGTVIMSDFTAENDDRNPTVAFVAGADRWLVGFQRGYTVNGNQVSTIRVYYHTRGNTLPNSGVAFSIPQISIAFFRNPDLGGTYLDATGVRGMLVYTSDPTSANGDHTKVVAVPIDAQTRQFLSAYEVGSAGVGTTYDREAPSVNQTSGQGDGWVLAWQELDRTVANDAWKVCGTRTDASGGELASAVIADGVSRHFTAPQVSGMRGSYMLTFTASDDLTTTAGAQVRSARLDWAQGANVPTAGVQNTLASASPPLTSLTNHGLALNHFIGATAVATWTRTSFIGLSVSRSAMLARLSGGGAVADPHTLFAVQDQSAISPAVTFTYPGERFALVYATTENPAQNPLLGRQYLYPTDAREFRYGTGCGPALISGQRPYIGNHTYSVGCTSAPANVPAALFVAFGPNTVPLDFLGMTGCAMNLEPAQVLFSLPGTSDGAGTVRIPLPLPEGTLSLYDIYLQIAYANPGANPANVQSTQGLRAQVR